VISPLQRSLTDNTQEKHIHAPSGGRTHNPSKEVTADPHLRRATTAIR